MLETLPWEGQAKLGSGSLYWLDGRLIDWQSTIRLHCPTVWNVQGSEGRDEQELQKINHVEPQSRREDGLHLHTP
jgi:hypothetical protein